MGKFNQVLTAAAASFGSYLMGLLNVWPSYTTSLYESEDTVLSSPMSKFEISLLGSIPSLGAMLGTAVTGVIIQKFGRKRGSLLLTVPLLLSWAIVELSKTSLPILVARFLGGLSGGAGLVYAPVYISETAEDSIRGALATGPVTLYCFGVLCSYMMGWFCSYYTIIYLNIAGCFFNFVLLAIITESPVFLLMQGREEDAKAAIAHYRDGSKTSKVVLQELSKWKQQITPAVKLAAVSTSEADANNEEAENDKLNNDDSQEAEHMPAWKKLFTSPASRRAFKVVGILLTMQVFMGMIAVQVNAKQLFAVAAPGVSSHLCSVLFAVVLLCGCLVAGGVADKAGRRILVVTSSFLVAVCMVTLGALVQTGAGPGWMTALFILLFCFSFNLGAGTIPYVLLAEVFTSEVQSFASIVLVEWAWFLNFFIIAVFPYLQALLGLHGLFYVFAGSAIINSVIAKVMVTETKGLSNEQIQDALLGRRK